MIPTIWPLYSIYTGELNKWLDPEQGVLWQTQDRPLFSAISSVFEIDPVLVVLGMVAIIYTTFVRREGFLLLWVLPFVIFSYFIGSSYFHMIPLIPVFCIAIAIAIGDIGERMRNIYKPQRPITDYFFQRDELLTKTKKMESYGDFYLLYSDLIKKFRFLGTLFRLISRRFEFLIVLPLALFGLMSIIALIQANVNSSYFITIAFMLQHLPDSDGDNNNDITIIGSPRYFWILEHIFDKDYFYKSYNSKTPIQTERNVFIVDSGARGSLLRNEVISDLYNTTRPIEIINTDASERIEIRSSDIQTDLN